MALIVGLSVGIGFDFLANAVIYEKPSLGFGSMQSILRPWGLLLGSVAGVLAAWSVLVLRLGSRITKFALWTAAIAFALLGAGTSLWILGWQFEPFTFEGAWIYPLAIGSLLVAALAAGKVRPRVGWVITGATLAFFGALFAWWAFTWGFPPPTFEGWGLYSLAAMTLLAAAFAANRAARPGRAPGPWDSP